MNEGAWEDEGVGFPGTILCERLYECKYIVCARQRERV